MITEYQDEICSSCKYHKFYFSPVGREYDTMTCKAGWTVSCNGCEKYKSLKVNDND